MKICNYSTKKHFLFILLVIVSFLFIYPDDIAAQDDPVTYHVAQMNPGASDNPDNPGTLESPFLTISRALQNLKPGDRVVIHEGVYRESAYLNVSGTKDKPITIESADNEHVIMRGSALVTSWERQEGQDAIYAHTGWPSFFGTWKAEISDARDQGRNQIYANGEYIREVHLYTDLIKGTFCIGKAAKTIYIWLKNDADPNTMEMEVSDREYCLRISAEYIIVRGINIEYGANGPQGDAMFRVAGEHNIIEDCNVQWAAGSGFALNGDYNTVRRCVFNNNGQIGFGSSRSDYCLFEDCETSYNNLHPGKKYDTNWEAGGNKIALSKAFNFLRHVSIGNDGPGIWYDISNDSCEVRNCFTKGNYGSGLFYEISYHLHACDNVMIGNGLSTSPGDWGANGGITLSSSPGCVVERNILINNVDGFQFREQIRETPEIIGSGSGVFGNDVPVWNHDQIIRNNIMSSNRRTQAKGWFDVTDGRHWTDSIRAELPEDERISSANAEWASVYQDSTNEPVDVTLGMLNLDIDNNYYWSATASQNIFQWGTDWNYNIKYNDLEVLSKELNFEKNGIIFNPEFTNWQKLDLRVLEDSPLLANDVYPQGEVPRVTLGIDYMNGIRSQVQNSPSLNIFPNPVKDGILNIDVSRFNPGDKLTLNIIDISGRQIYTSPLLAKNPGNSTARLEISSSFSPGIYIVSVKGSDMIMNGHIIIEN